MDRIGPSGPWLQNEPRTHTLTWVLLGAVTTEKPAWPPFEEGRATRPRALGQRKGLPDPQPVGSFGAGPKADPGPAVGQPRTQDDPEGSRLLPPPNTASPPAPPLCPENSLYL